MAGRPVPPRISDVPWAFVALAGVVLYGDRLGARAIVGIAVIILGVVVLVTSGSTRQG